MSAVALQQKLLGSAIAALFPVGSVASIRSK